jgi:hypothetical protein
LADVRFIGVWKLARVQSVPVIIAIRHGKHPDLSKSAAKRAQKIHANVTNNTSQVKALKPRDEQRESRGFGGGFYRTVFDCAKH